MLSNTLDSSDDLIAMLERQDQAEVAPAEKAVASRYYILKPESTAIACWPYTFHLWDSKSIFVAMLVTFSTRSLSSSGPKHYALVSIRKVYDCLRH